jgi:mitochondrial import inner membrane translocase subunit TIM9
MDLNAAEQAQLESIMQRKQQKEFMRMFFKVTSDCFDSCINDFTTKVLSSKEVTSPVMHAYATRSHAF